MRAIIRALRCSPCCRGRPAFAQTYPNKTIRMIVPFGGRRSDRRDRARGRAKGERGLGTAGRYRKSAWCGRQHRHCDGGARAADGYTVMAVSTGFMVNPSMYAKLPYHPIADFSPITLVAASPNVITVHPRCPPRRSAN